MTNVSYTLDWIRFTVPYTWVETWKGTPTFIGGKTKETKPILSYNCGVSNEYHSIYWHDLHPEFRVMIEITGVNLSKLREAGYAEKDVISDALRCDARFTRIDFACDLFDTGGCPTDILECFLTDQILTTSRTIGRVEKTQREKSLGTTIYLGARQSERMVRIYDKGKQTKTNLDWIRVEIENKGERAEQLAGLIMAHDVTEAGLSYLRDVIEWSDIEWLESMWTGEYTLVNIDKIGRPETDRERWLRTVVIPVVENELESGSQWLREALITLLIETEKYSGHGPSIR